MKRTLAILVTACVSTSVVYAADDPSDLFGKFFYVTGKVEMKKKDAEERASVKRGDSIHYGDMVWTGENSRATIMTLSKKIVNLVPNSELNTSDRSKEPKGKLLKLLPAEGLFEKTSSADSLVAVMGVRAELEYILSPRYSAIKTTTPVIYFRPLPENHSYAIKITGGGLPSPFKGSIESNVLDLSKVELRKPLDRETTYFIQAELVDQRGGLRGKERDVFIRPISDEELAKITAIEKEIAQLQKTDPDNTSYSVLLAAAYEDMGLYSDALTIYEALHREQPDDEFIRDKLAIMYNQVKLVTELINLTQPKK
ncbi:MAG: tetratricopeptide repeat protein [bacterium]